MINSYKLSDIKYEGRDFFVLEVGDRGFEVYERGITHAKRVSQIGRGKDPYCGLNAAIRECTRRQELRLEKEAETLRLAKIVKTG